MHRTSPDADGFDAVLGSVDFTLCWPDHELINVFMVKLLLAVSVIA